MANETPSVNGSDPAVQRQVDQQTAKLLPKAPLATAPSITPSGSATKATPSSLTRSVAPIVSGAETIYPQSTASTNTNSVTITSSINNQEGDVTTVYTSGSRITVNPINQTINQYTAVDSGVSAIVAGNGVTISSTGSGGKGVVTINAGAFALGNIAALNLDGNSANVLHGDGTWSADQTTYSNSNVASYLPTYNGNLGVANISSPGNLNVTANTLTWLFDNTGALHWPGGIGQIDTNNSTFEIHSTNGLQISTNEANASQSFLFATDGSVYCPANAYFEGTRLNVGPGAGNVPLATNPTLVVTDTGLEYIQAALINQSSNGSSDYAAYGADSDETQGFADLGFAGHTFNDPNYTITEPGDGYVFSQGYANGIGGALVLATGEYGNVPDIVFATGGFLANAEFARIDHANNVFHLTRAGSGIQFADGTIQTTAGGGGTASELVNGDNSFVLDNDGNVVFEGTPSGNAVDRGIVWDFGANANGVNSQIRQDLNGLSVRAWTESGGGANGFSAPVNIITNQDAATNTWTFDGQGNLTVPSGSINSINDGGQLGAQVLLQPDLGQARIAGRSSEYTENFNSGGWTSASYTGTQVDITDAPNLLGFVSNNTIFTSAVNRTFSINGGEPVLYTGYGASGNNVTLYTDIAADPDPTVVTSIDFYYQSESSVGIDYDDGTLNINATGLTINLDNDQTSGPDINLRSGDDITLQAKNKALGSESEGGDININAGAGASDDGLGNTSSTGGDIIIDAGDGGDGNTGSGSQGGFTTIRGGVGGFAGVASPAGSGGYVNIQGGDAGSYAGGNAALGAVGGNVSISAGLTTQEGVNGPNVVISSGQGGPNALAGSVVISTPASANGPGGDWVFDGYGNLILANGNSVIQSIANSSLDPTLPNVSTMVFTPDANYNSQVLVLDPTAPGHIHLRAYAFSNIDEPAANIFLGGEDTSFEVTSGANNQAVIHSGGNDWTFGADGRLTFPGTPRIDTDANNFEVQAAENINFEANAVVNIYTDAGNTTYQWQFGDDGNLIVPGNTAISTSNATGGNAGNSITIKAGAADQSDYYTTAGGNLNLVGGLGATDDGGGGGPGGDVNIASGLSADPAGHAGNINITAGSNDWVFDYNGDLTVPGNLVYIGASPAPSISGFNSVSAEEFTNDTSNVTINANSNTWNFDSTGNLTIPSTSGGFIKTAANASIGIVAMDNGTNNPAQLLSMNVGNGNATSIVSAYATNVAIQTNASGAINTWQFDNAGNLTLPANTFAINYANGTQVSLSGSTIANGNSNVSIATANGNVTISAVGNTTMTVTGTGANVTGTLTSTGKIGYSTGGNATQASTGAGVTVNQLTGLVTLANRTYNAGDLEAFSISCNKVSNDDFVLVQMVDSVNAPSYNVVAYPNTVLANTISVLVKTLETVGTDTPILKFMIVKAPIS